MSVRANLGDRTVDLDDRHLVALRRLDVDEFRGLPTVSEAQMVACLCRGPHPLVERAPDPERAGRTVYRLTRNGKALLARVGG